MLLALGVAGAALAVGHGAHDHVVRCHGGAGRGDRADLGARGANPHAPRSDAAPAHGVDPHRVHGIPVRAAADVPALEDRAAQRGHLVAGALAPSRGRARVGADLARSVRHERRGAEGDRLPPRVRERAPRRAKTRRRVVPRQRPGAHGRRPRAGRGAAPGLRGPQALRHRRDRGARLVPARGALPESEQPRVVSEHRVLHLARRLSLRHAAPAETHPREHRADARGHADLGGVSRRGRGDGPRGPSRWSSSRGRRRCGSISASWASR